MPPWVEERKVGDQVFRYIVWRAKVRGPDGRLRWKRRSKPVGQVPMVAARALDAEHATVELGRAPRPKHVGPLRALDEFLKEWAEVKRRRPDTITFYRTTLTPLFTALAARAPLRSWQSRWLVEHIAAHPDWSPRTIQIHLRALRTFTRWARKRGYACSDFAETVDGPRVSKPVRAAYSVAELRAILGAAEGRALAPAVFLAALAGLSLGDLRTLRWGSVDLAGGWIVAPRSKTGRDMKIPLGKRLRAFLKALPAGEPGDLVCSIPTSSSTTYQGWTRLCKAAGVTPRGGFKRLRHTYATLLDAAKVDSATRRDLMAHAPGSRETDGYTHTDSARLRAGIAAIDKAVSP